MPIQRKHRRGVAPLADERPTRASGSSKSDALLVAVREKDEIHGLLNVAELLARKKRINAHLIALADHQTTVNNRRSSNEHNVGHEHDRDRLRIRTKRRLHQTLGLAVYWSTDAAFGSLATALARETRRRRPRFILLAASSTGSSLRDARAILKTANAVDAPVLVVPPHQDLLPTNVLVATDFSQSSKRAALAAISVIGPRGRLTLVHVEPARKSDAPRGHAARRDASAQRVSQLLQELRREIDEEARSRSSTSRSHGIVKDTLLLRGEPASAILESAAQRKSDLIVLGTRRLSKSGSMPRRSVAIAVLVGAGCAVLVARPSGHTAV
jgi:nucleotide-binding universal stress UspA family protein